MPVSPTKLVQVSSSRLRDSTKSHLQTNPHLHRPCPPPNHRTTLAGEPIPVFSIREKLPTTHRGPYRYRWEGGC
ncbi:uncharacterized protein LAJ45_01853 [Morchella importuna]|uniref:uncharacterized protein n=1 Tax=Morchella importuna TaxID=1174673 RepID=UPI001E8CE989|nr:uncharacterized protein LAJ45_01853 [Morchella importuna]KAH8154086.1 hypothetical protein LAJ45_01853 [Morchella importuna]